MEEFLEKKTLDEDKDIQLARKNKEEFRKVFIIGGEAHSYLFAYIKDKEGKEAVLFADSHEPKKEYAEQLSEAWGIPVYFSHLGRQADLYSCHTDALALGRIISARNNLGEYFRLPDFLSKLEARVVEELKPPKPEVSEDTSLDQKEQKTKHKVFQARLPSELQITSQRSAFFEFHKEQNDRAIYRGENIEQHRRRFTQPVKVKGKDDKVETKPTSMYLIKKGRKYGNIIEIQYYINLIKSRLKEENKSDLWDEKIRNDFVIKAKAEFENLKAQHKYESLWDEYMDREKRGLYDFAEDYFNKLLNNKLVLGDLLSPLSPSSLSSPSSPGRSER